MSDNATFEQARELFLQGVQHFESGRLAEAERCFAGSLALVPGRPSTLTNLGAARLKLGRAEEACAVLEEALAQEPANVEALGFHGTALAELGRHREALSAFDRALAAQPNLAQVWALRGSVLNDLQRPTEAAQSYRKAMSLGDDPELNRFYLGALAAGAAPATAPRHYVQSLFDDYAEGFDSQLVEVLRYQAPEVLARRLTQLRRRFDAALDLGCGTGLCGKLLKPMVDRLEGVDLAPRMLARAAESGVYDRLEQADIVDFLRGAGARYDLVIAADVFIYVGALEEVFAETAAHMVPGGVFCFSVEDASDEERMVLRRSRRYAHSEAYIRELAAANGFTVQAIERAPVRHEQRAPIPGLYFWLERSG